MKKRKKDTATLPEPGAAFAFPIGDGRFSVVRILAGRFSEQAIRLKGEVVLAACGAWIGDSVPIADDPSLRPILRKNHHGWKDEPSIIWISEEVPADFVSIGSIAPTVEEGRIVCNSFGGWRSLTLHPLLQWRWDNDRDAVLAEDAIKASSDSDARRRAQQERTEFLNRVALSDLRGHQFFPQWKKYPPMKAVRASRKIMHDTVERLLELGLDSSESSRMQVLQECIESFNELDTQLHFIETGEREDICEEFEAVVHACGLQSHQDMADKWRAW